MQRNKSNAHFKIQTAHVSILFTNFYILTNLHRHITNIQSSPQPSTVGTRTSSGPHLPSTPRNNDSTTATKKPHKLSVAILKKKPKNKRTGFLYVIGPNGKGIWRNDESSTFQTLATDTQQIYIDNWDVICTHSRSSIRMNECTHFHPNSVSHKMYLFTFILKQIYFQVSIREMKTLSLINLPYWNWHIVVICICPHRQWCFTICP